MRAIEREKFANRLDLRFQPSVRQALNEAAECEDVSVSAFVRQATIEKLQTYGFKKRIHENLEAA